MVLDPDNVAALKKGGLIIWLKADRDTLLRRMEKDPRTPLQRPSLTGREAREELEEVLTFRNPFYEEAAEASLDTSSLDVAAVVERGSFHRQGKEGKALDGRKFIRGPLQDHHLGRITRKGPGGRD